MIGRSKEQKTLTLLLKREKSSFVAVTGRRRVGKTFLIDDFFQDHLCFRITGIQNGTFEEQLVNFHHRLNHSVGQNKKKAEGLDANPPENWQEAFQRLRSYLDSLSSRKKKVIFVDELPWMATPRSNMLQHLAHLWNDYLSKKKHFILVVCGSASSWLTAKVLNDPGGLHNRVSDHINLHPFTLKETKAFLEHKGIRLSHQEIAKIYMTFGGVPYYLEQIRRGENATVAIERICFSNEGMLKNEYGNLYKALFRNPEYHESVVEVLASKSSGLTRKEIIQQSKLKAGGAYDRTMNDLLMSGFISEFLPYGKKKRGVLYRLNDEFSIFYHRFMKTNRSYSKGIWAQLSASQSYKIWTGYAFESVCMKHIDEIKHALGISAVYTEVSGFRVEGNTYEKGFQIDLVLDRKDDVIHLFEIKYYAASFKIDKDYARNLRERKQRFIEHTGTKKQVFTSFITNHGIKENAFSHEVVDSELILDDFFE
ncbi:MAG: AAA family ATPase [Flavobacteriales bacterium]|nr:AAA family ATPase [Flavobacteriales bacterium]